MMIVRVLCIVANSMYRLPSYLRTRASGGELRSYVPTRAYRGGALPYDPLRRL